MGSNNVRNERWMSKGNGVKEMERLRAAQKEMMILIVRYLITAEE